MSRGQTLRALVNERLAAAAEDIFVLFERTIAEYEEELCRSKEENQRKQQLLDKVLIQIPSTSSGPSLNKELAEIPQTKGAQSVKQEEEQLPVLVPLSGVESSAVCVKTEESSLLQQRQTEHEDETQGEAINSQFLSETDRHSQHITYTDWAQFSWASAPMGTEADGTHCRSDQNKSAPETTVHSEHMLGAHRGGGCEWKKHQCLFCNMRFGTKYHLETHIRIHTGEKPYSCLICDRTFAKKVNLDAHKRTHTGKKPYSCSICNKAFAKKDKLEIHKRTHTGEKPYSCSSCMKRFADPSVLRMHTRTHTGERPYSCSICEKTFAKKVNLHAHKRTHTGERPYRCSMCEKTFTQKSTLLRHNRTHSKESSHEHREKFMENV